MVNFKELLDPVFVTDNFGNRVNIDDVENKSITNLFSAIRLMKEDPPVITKSKELKILSDEIIARLLVNYQNRLIEIFLSDDSSSWGITYNQQVVFFIDSLFSRSKDIFKELNINYLSKHEKELRSRVNSSFFGAVITINDKEYTLNELDKAMKLIEAGELARVNSAGNKLLIYNYSDKDFVKAVEKGCQYVHFDDDLFAIPFIMIEFMERFGYLEYIEEVFMW